MPPGNIMHKPPFHGRCLSGMLARKILTPWDRARLKHQLYAQTEERRLFLSCFCTPPYAA